MLQIFMEQNFFEWLQYCWSLMPIMLDGLKITLELFALTILCALPLGLIVALMNISKWLPLRAIGSTYVWVLRGTPLLLQLFFVYYGLPYIPIIGIALDRFPAAVLTFILNYSAYFSEIFRAGVLSIEVGQYEAARSSGMTGYQMMTRIILPQTIRRVIPPIANETITLVKDTALVTSIGVMELLQAAKSSVNRDVDATAFLVAAIFYLLLTLVLTVVFKSIEKKYSKHEIR